MSEKMDPSSFKWQAGRNYESLMKKQDRKWELIKMKTAEILTWLEVTKKAKFHQSHIYPLPK